MWEKAGKFCEGIDCTTGKAAMRRLAAVVLGTLAIFGALAVPASADTGLGVGPISLGLPGAHAPQFAQLQGMNINVGRLLG